MTAEERDQEAARVADFRYGIIAELANPYLNREQRRRLLREKSRVSYEGLHKIGGTPSIPGKITDHPVGVRVFQNIKGR